MGGELNNCVRLDVACARGRFTSRGRILVTRHQMELPTAVKAITFVPVRSQYTSAPHGPSAYWVMPLVNFVSDFLQAHPDLSRHPLRIYPTPEIPAGLSRDDHLVASIEAGQKDRLIVFELHGKLGFIEPLPDYEERESRLESGAERCLVTALMVGHAPSDPADWEGLRSWFPFDLLNILSLATGSEVGTPWVEFRDEGGGLVRRFHGSMGRRGFTPGHRVIHELPHRGTGLLLTRSLASPEFGKPYLHVAIRHLVRGGAYEGSPLEDRFNHIARALDSLAARFKVDHADLLGELPAHAAKTVSDALGLARDTLAGCADEAAAEGRADAEKVLRRIAARLGSNVTSAWDFGQSVARLAALFKFPDAEIAESYYAATPRFGGKKWTEALSKNRAKVMHGRFFNFGDDPHELYDVLSILEHLHDLLTRVVLTVLGYEGCYQPAPKKWVGVGATREWVKPDTQAKELGYGAQGS
jgi:hypothetical protein